jgi:hypothetical protein
MLEEYQSTLSQSQETIQNTNTTPLNPPELPTTDNSFDPLDELHPAFQMYLDISQLTPKQRQAKIRERWDNPDSLPLQGMTEDDLFNAVMSEFLQGDMGSNSPPEYHDSIDSLRDDLEDLIRQLQDPTRNTEQYPEDAEAQECVDPLASYIDGYLQFGYQNDQLEADERAFQLSKWQFIRSCAPPPWQFIRSCALPPREFTIIKRSSNFSPLIHDFLLFLLASFYCVAKLYIDIFPPSRGINVSMSHSINLVQALT